MAEDEGIRELAVQRAVSPVGIIPRACLPAGFPAIPVLLPEAVMAPVLYRAGTGVDEEPLADLDGSGLAVLHSYANAGWQHAVARQLLRPGLVQRLDRARRSLPAGYGLAIFDAWRPLALQQELYAAADGMPPGAVAAPSADPAAPPPHLTGGAVDLTLTWNGVPLSLGTAFDGFGEHALTAAFESSPGPVRALRRLLYWTLRAQGLIVLAEEWWHFEYGTRLWSTITRYPVRYQAAKP
jgi:D-alanyl-D-alanine dipeptidase